MKNIEDTRIYKLEEALNASGECKTIDKALDALFEEIKIYLPEDKKDVIIKIEDCFTDLLILHEEYFYENGFLDSIKAALSSAS